jgi:hypothetical protein
VKGGQQSDHRDVQVAGRENTQRAASVEVAQPDGSRRRLLTPEQRRDQEAGDHEEDAHA